MSATKRFFLEVCMSSVEDARAAEEGGADRLELNSALSLGGLTPSLGTLIEVRAVTRLPLIVMTRPRSGGFCYTESEYRIMRLDIDLALEHGADGIAFGVLTASGEVDREPTRAIVRQIGDKDAVFHRAFDVTPDPAAALETLVDLGVRRVLTSGQEPSAIQGASLIRSLIQQSARRIEILPAAGIKPDNVAGLIAATGCDQVHASLRETRSDGSMAARPQIRFGPADEFDSTSAERVRQMVKSMSECDNEPRTK
jgi:copper homeostasis protein